MSNVTERWIEIKKNDILFIVNNIMQDREEHVDLTMLDIVDRDEVQNEKRMKDTAYSVQFSIMGGDENFCVSNIFLVR